MNCVNFFYAFVIFLYEILINEHPHLMKIPHPVLWIFIIQFNKL